MIQLGLLVGASPVTEIANFSRPKWLGCFLPLHLFTKMDPVFETVYIKYTPDSLHNVCIVNQCIVTDNYCLSFFALYDAKLCAQPKHGCTVCSTWHCGSAARPVIWLINCLNWLFYDVNIENVWHWMMEWLTNMEQMVEWGLTRETEVFRETLPQCHITYCRSHMAWSGIKPGPIQPGSNPR
jgi:hypothetical protein